MTITITEFSRCDECHKVEPTRWLSKYLADPAQPALCYECFHGRERNNPYYGHRLPLGLHRCPEERHWLAIDGTDGGGHVQCLETLRPGQECPWKSLHHDAWIAEFRAQTTCSKRFGHLGSCRC